MPHEGFVSLTLKQGLVRKVDDFVARNDLGFTNRAEVAAAAIREFLERHPTPPPTIDESLERIRKKAQDKKPTR